MNQSSELKRITFINRIGLILAFGSVAYLLELSDHPIDCLLAGLVANFLVIGLLKLAFTRHHLIGITYLHEHAFEDALKEFKKSYQFFKRFPFLDRLRTLVFLNPSLLSYQEKALFHMGLCYSQLGNTKETIKTYEKALREFPNSQFVQETLSRVLKALKNGKKTRFDLPDTF